MHIFYTESSSFLFQVDENVGQTSPEIQHNYIISSNTIPFTLLNLLLQGYLYGYFIRVYLTALLEYCISRNPFLRLKLSRYKLLHFITHSLLWGQTCWWVIELSKFKFKRGLLKVLGLGNPSHIFVLFNCLNILYPYPLCIYITINIALLYWKHY